MSLKNCWRIFFLTSALLLASCGGGGGGSPDAGADGNNSSNDDSSNNTSSESEVTYGTIRLANNNSELAIDRFYLALESSESWGINQLSAPLEFDRYIDINQIPTGTYKALAVVEGASSIYFASVFGVSVTDVDVLAIYTIDASFTGSININNLDGADDITELYIVPAGGPWGDSLLIDGEVILAAENYHLIEVLAGVYNIKVVWSDDTSQEFFSSSVQSLSLLEVHASK
ncbi:MAG: hypothetical protein OEZ33_10535 [Gammaproteobacteria bacterium]|nr:hypothetical protein [Gammaproteobacteria bacterium]